MSIQIRTGQPEDGRTIASFQVAMAKETEDKVLDPSIVEPAVEKVFKDPAKGFYVVATSEENDKPAVIGSLLITYEWSDWRNSNMWYIQSVYVTPDFRGKGVFKRLYQHVIELAKENDVMFVRLYVEVENERAQRVYESLGMKKMPYYMYDIKVDS